MTNQSYDFVVRGGTVVNGIGGEAFRADVADSEGLIVPAAPELGGACREEIDARGMLVTPSTDIHTHYHGQVMWESRLSPSPDHGGTTVITGNCGVRFAPCYAEDRDNLISLMGGVEDTPEVVLAECLPWNWESFPDYLDAAAERKHDAGIAAVILHLALRLYVMCDRAIARENATPADIERKGVLVRPAVRAGALCFATSRALRTRAAAACRFLRCGQPRTSCTAFSPPWPIAAAGCSRLLSNFEQYADVEGEVGMLRRLV